MGRGAPAMSSPFYVGLVTSSLRVKLRWARMYISQPQLHRVSFPIWNEYVAVQTYVQTGKYPEHHWAVLSLAFSTFLSGPALTT